MTLRSRASLPFFEVGEVRGGDGAFSGGLPECAGGDVEGREEAVAEGEGVDADEVVADEGAVGFLRGVAADDVFSGVVRGALVAAFPEEHVVGLLGHGEVGVDVGVDEDVGFGFEIGDEVVFEEVPVCGGDVAEFFVRAVGGEGRVAAVQGPFQEGDGVRAGVEHELFVVSHEGGDVEVFAESEEAVEDAGGVRAAIDVVAKEDEVVFGCGEDGV